MLKKSLIRSLLYLISFAASTSFLNAHNDELDLLTLDSFSCATDINSVQETKNDSENMTTRNPSFFITPIATLLASDVTKLYISTAPVRSRHHAYISQIFPQHYDNMHIHFFVNFQTQTKMVFPFVDRINFDFITPAGEAVIEALAGDKYVYFKAGRALFQQMTVQERRGIFSTIFEIPLPSNFFLRSEISLIGMQRNYWADEELQKKGLELFKQVEQATGLIASNDIPDSTITDLKDSLAAIPSQFGFGDPKIQCGYKVFHNKVLNLIIGLECLPSLSALTEKTIKIPEIETNSIMGEVERINQITRKPILGNNGHWGLGSFIEAKIPLYRDKIDIFTKMSFDKILAKKRVRDIAINHEIFPRLILVESEPGGISHILCGIHIEHQGWNLNLGYDFYKQEKESLYFVKGESKNTKDANLAKACQKESIQHSIFSSINYCWKEDTVEWLTCGLHGSGSLKEEGIGAHWHVGLKVSLLL